MCAPIGSLDAHFKAEAHKRGCHERNEDPPKGAELRNPGHLIRGRKRAALTATRASAGTGHKERTPWSAGHPTRKEKIKAT